MTQTTAQSTAAPDRAAILDALSAYHRAMVNADTAALEKLLDRDYSLTHITGYEQPKTEWFGVMRSGAFDDHRIDLDATFTDVQVNGNTALVRGRGIFNATINGMKNPWRLQFVMQWVRQDGQWRVKDARYSTF